MRRPFCYNLCYPKKEWLYAHNAYVSTQNQKATLIFTIGVAYFRSGTLMNGRLRFNFINFSFNTFTYDERFDSDFTFGNAGIRMLSSPSFGVYATQPLFMC